MLSYSLKRLLLSIPVVWILITMVFLLSKLLPGTHASETIQYGEGNTYINSSQQQRDQVYKEYLIRTGQSLPIFYFSIGSLVTPAQNATNFTASGALLEKLSWRYGDKQKAKAYHDLLSTLSHSLKRDQSRVQSPYLYKLQHTLQPDSILHYTNALTQQLTKGKAQTAAVKTHQAAIAMLQSESTLNYLLPALEWHGSNNQYHRWFLLLIQGDLGKSYKDARPVLTVLWDAAGNTFWLILISMVLTVILALELSIIMVRKTLLDWHKMLLPVLYVLDSIPLFVLSLILLVLFATPEFLQLFPVFGLGYHSSQSDTWYGQLFESGPYLVLPTTCLVLANLPYLTNQLYRALADTMHQDFIKTARSKGLTESNIIRRHALRNALLPVITVLSDFLPALVAGSVVIETIFAIPGIGRLLITSVLARDFPVIIGIILMIALVKMVSHLIADICYAKADPRVSKTTTS